MTRRCDLSNPSRCGAKTGAMDHVVLNRACRWKCRGLPLIVTMIVGFLTGIGWTQEADPTGPKDDHRTAGKAGESSGLGPVSDRPQRELAWDEHEPPRRDAAKEGLPATSTWPARGQTEAGSPLPPPFRGGDRRGPPPPGLRDGTSRSGRFFPGGPPVMGVGDLALERLKQLDPEMYELEKKDRELDGQSVWKTRQFAQAAPEQRDALRKQLLDLVNAHFDVRQQRRQLQLKRLDDELKKLRAAVEQREKLRDQIVAKRVSELTGEEDPLDF